MPQPSRGEVWMADLDPTVGHEQAGRRPVLVVSTNSFNHGPADLAFVLPLTRRERGVPVHVRVGPPEGGLTVTSFIMCDALRSVSRQRLGSAPRGRVTRETLSRVEDCLRTLLEL